jgi:hypothetical protein
MGARWVGPMVRHVVALLWNEDIPALENSEISQILVGQRPYGDICDLNILNFGFENRWELFLEFFRE